MRSGSLGKNRNIISKHAKNLIKAILNPNPTKRPSLQQIMESKWMQNNVESASDDDFIQSLVVRQFKMPAPGKHHLVAEEFIPKGFLH